MPFSKTIQITAVDLEEFARFTIDVDRLLSRVTYGSDADDYWVNMRRIINAWLVEKITAEEIAIAARAARKRVPKGGRTAPLERLGSTPVKQTVQEQHLSRAAKSVRDDTCLKGLT